MRPALPHAASAAAALRLGVGMAQARDDDALARALMQALLALLPVRRLALHPCVVEGGEARWASVATGERAAEGAAPMVDWHGDARSHDALPTRDSHPARSRAVRRQQWVWERSLPARTLHLPLPMMGGGQAVLELSWGQRMMPAQRALLQGLLQWHAAQVALLEYAHCDSLTGLLNRKTFDEGFLKTAAGIPGSRAGEGPAQAEAQGFYLAVCDIDHFKSVNDRFGHLIGDEVLLQLAHLMRACFRAQDRLYRFGGEEFVVLLRCPSDADAQAAFERFRARVEAYAFPRVERVTISIGFARVRAGDAPAAAFGRADLAVYAAKTAGRNRVVQSADEAVHEADATGGEVELF